MASEQIISARVSKEYFEKFNAFVDKGEAPVRGARTAAIVEALDRYMTACAGCLETFTLMAERDFALAEVEKLKAKAPKVDRLPSHKVKREVKPLSQHTKARMAVYQAIQDNPRTSSEIAYITGQHTPNVAKRLQELVAENLIKPTGGYRKSRDSGKMLRVYRRTSMVYNKGE